MIITFGDTTRDYDVDYGEGDGDGEEMADR